MKNLLIILSLFLLATTSLKAQRRLDTNAERIAIQNIVRTAWIATGHKADAFNPAAVSVSGGGSKGDMSAWVKNSNTLGRKIGILLRMEAKGRLYHLMPSVLRNKQQAWEILKAHYSM